jgi:hypothetical protein
VDVLLCLRVSLIYRLEVYRCDGVRLLPPAGEPAGDQNSNARCGNDEVRTSDLPYQNGVRYSAQLSITSVRYHLGHRYPALADRLLPVSSTRRRSHAGHAVAL